MRPEASGDDDEVVWLADVLAHANYFRGASRAAVLERLGVEAARLDAALDAWSARRHAELARGDATLTRRFGVAFGATRRRLTTSRPELSAIGPLRALDLDRTQEASGAVLRPVMPFAAGPVATAGPISSPDRPPVRRSGDVDATAELVGAVLREATPFRAGSSARSPATVAPIAPIEQPLDLDATVGIASGVLAPALPFTEAAASGGRAVIAVPPRVGPNPSAGATVALSSGDASAHGPPPEVAPLTLQQYASLRVELQRAAEPEATILGRYRVTAASRPALEAYWRGRFEADPLLRMVYVKAHASYAAWLRCGAD